MRKESNPLPPAESLRPQPSPSPPPKEQLIKIEHIYNTDDNTIILFEYLKRIEDKLQTVLDYIDHISA